jgi:hypothetical protein
MDTLLNQLKEQDLELYQEIVADLLPSSDHRNNFIICGKLQEAIRARGWIFELNSKLCEGGLCSAWVFKNLKEWKKDQFDPTAEYINMGGDTEAEALLRAYLAAIHSE